MKIDVLEPSGFCAGVQRALRLASKKLEEIGPSSAVYFENSLVHNEYINTGLGYLHSFAYYKGQKLKSGDLFVISAHGHNLDLSIKGRDYEILDCFCPILKSRYEIIKNHIKQGEIPLYYGKEGHPESISTLSYIHLECKTDVKVIKSLDELEIDDDKRYILITQSSLNLDLSPFEDKDNLFVLPPCFVCKDRFEKIAKISDDYNTFVVIGGKNSSNSTGLYEEAKRAHPNKKVFQVLGLMDVYDIEDEILGPVLLASGTSVSSEVVDSIYAYLRAKD